MPNKSEAEVFSRLGELSARRDSCRAELVGFADHSELTAEQSARFEALETEHTSLTAEHDELSQRAALFSRVRSTLASRNPRSVEHIGGDAGMRGSAEHGQHVGASMRAIDLAHGADELSDAASERAERLVRNADTDPRIAEWVAVTGSEHYRSAFNALLRYGPTEAPLMLSDAESAALRSAGLFHRAISEGSGAQGGFLVPFYLDPTINLTNAGSLNPFREVSRVEAIATNEWHGVTSAGVTAGYLAEGVEASDDTPDDFAQPTIATQKASAYLEATFEATQDTNIGAQVSMLLADAKANFEAGQFAVGDGASGHMQGVVTGVAAAAGSVVQTATAATFAVEDVYDVHDAVTDRAFAHGASWVAHRKISSKIRQFATGTGQNVGAFWATLGEGNPPELLGNPILTASAMDSTVATGSNIALIGDFSEYLIVDRIGMVVQYNPLVVGSNGRPNGKVGWFAYWRTGAGVLDPGAFRLLQVK